MDEAHDHNKEQLVAVREFLQAVDQSAVCRMQEG
jgi:hypothetical protein